MPQSVPDGVREFERIAFPPMHAITVREPGGPEVLEWTEAPDPVAGPGEVVVDVVASRGQPRRPHAAAGPLPAAARARRRSSGWSARGGSRRSARASTGWSVGDEVCALLAGGGYAEKVAVPAAQLLPVPDGRRPRHGGRAARGGVHGVVERRGGGPARRGRDVPRAGRQQRHRHARDPGGEGARRAGRGHGGRARTGWSAAASSAPTSSIDYHDDIPAELKKATDGHGADVILDNMGAKGLAANIDALAPDGRLVIIGMQGGTKAELDIAQAAAQARAASPRWGCAAGRSTGPRQGRDRRRRCASRSGR